MQEISLWSHFGRNPPGVTLDSTGMRFVTSGGAAVRKVPAHPSAGRLQPGAPAPMLTPAAATRAAGRQPEETP